MEPVAIGLLGVAAVCWTAAALVLGRAVWTQNAPESYDESGEKHLTDMKDIVRGKNWKYKLRRVFK